MEGRKGRFGKSREILRLSIGAMFLLTGLCFASWASRIATIQQYLNLSEAALGGILLALPIGLMISLLVSGWALSRLGSKKLAIVGGIGYGLALCGIGLAESPIQLILVLMIFGFCSNAVNISINTQAVIAERFFEKPIMGTFHGLWSLAGFCGAGLGTLMVALHISPFYHFLIVLAIMVLVLILVGKYLKNDAVKKKEGSKTFVWPDKQLLTLGAIAFCSMICEGTMFDWSVVYFKKIIQPDIALVGLGYTGFMASMAIGRFISDYFAGKYGVLKIIQGSGILIAAGLLLAVIFPTFISALLGFLLVGFGVSSVVPMVYSAAGKSKVMSPGLALTAVSTIGFFGFLLGPPVIGFLAQLTSLRGSFLFVALMGITVYLIASMLKSKRGF
ncbi:major facilitator superfamily MFS_1 [Pseudopedobacter saltans DSM 12145]|uniref:Major facilitator superfamily MFS_1 n=1 Tax=Pseudopedobacter saltans (strain ATCC 51119 / DSM 12145 / JCM 21818 / CCUG 39354 / LMG 10337 / NBRC 100064 / NCIMB 13643) TaxID=762903 RepID=F0S5A6_PSESL|nr:MFS transporter [Pseudopedobacter saltans]ADY52051.1 major facilitator superfamily MFS_1 [Pseudopedobacter saltans DSM 12145]